MDAILLAAGNSVRFGANKLLYSLNGKKMYRNILELLYTQKDEQKLEHVIVVSQYEEIFREIKEDFPGIETVRNDAPQRGISSSIRLGLEYLKKVSDHSAGCLFTVADQPYLSIESLEKIQRTWEQYPKGITAASHGERIGNPVIFSSDYYEELCQLSGDVGGKKVLYRHREDTRLVEIPEYELEDMDTPDRLEKYFPFLEERDHVISIVGAGGKSTLMDTLAKIYANKGKKVVVTTTTHIGKPKQHPVAYNTCDLKQLFQKRQIVVAGEDASEYKLRASQQMGITDYQASADIVLIEADGAKHFPSKVPIETEPVIVSESDIVIGVMGMDAIGITLKEGCFRLERAMEVLKTDAQHVMTVADAAAILSSDWGTRKNVENKDYYIVLNKCDNQIRRRYAEEIKELLAARGIFQVSCISLRYGNFLDVM